MTVVLSTARRFFSVTFLFAQKGDGTNKGLGNVKTKIVRLISGCFLSLMFKGSFGLPQDDTNAKDSPARPLRSGGGGRGTTPLILHVCFK
jgi:hypothetical protein